MSNSRTILEPEQSQFKNLLMEGDFELYLTIKMVVKDEQKETEEGKRERRLSYWSKYFINE